MTEVWRSIIERIVDSLVGGDLDAAREHLADYPPGYRSQLLDPDGKLMPAGVEDGLNYRIGKSPRALLVSGYRSGKPVDDGPVSDVKLLRVLQLIDSAGLLTEFGQMRAIESLPLSQQCEILGLPLRRIIAARNNPKVEDDALDLFRTEGWGGVRYEAGPFLMLFKAMCQGVLKEFAEESGRRGSSNRGVYLEAILIRWPEATTTPQERRTRFLAAIETAGEDDIAAGFADFFPRSHFRKDYPLLSLPFLIELSRALTKDQLVQLGRFFSENPYAHRSGWPDLVLVRNGTVHLVEVKARDRLHLSQIRVLPTLRSIVPRIEVLQVDRVERPE